MPNQTNQIEEDEIDLIALAKTLWEGRKTIVKTTLIFMCIGLFVAIFSEKEYTASTTFVPQTSDSKVGGSLGGLAAMAGINLGGMNSDSGISPTLYPQILSSIPFQKELLQTPLTIEGLEKQVSFQEYYTTIYTPSLLGYIKKYTIGLPGIIISVIKGKTDNVIQNRVEGSNLLTISEEEDKLIKQLSKQIALEVNEKDGYVTITSNMPKAIAAAELTERIQELLQHYIIAFKVQKSSEKLQFITDRYIEKETAFKLVQKHLATYKDQNQNVNSLLAQTKLQELQSAYDLTFSIYNELAKQLETQQIQVKEDTPVFTVIKPVTVPIEKAKPKRAIILLIGIFLGVIIGIGTVFGRVILGTLKEKWVLT